MDYTTSEIKVNVAWVTFVPLQIKQKALSEDNAFDSLNLIAQIISGSLRENQLSSVLLLMFCLPDGLLFLRHL